MFLASVPEYHRQVVLGERVREQPTREMAFGSAVDVILFGDQEEWDARFLVVPQWDARTTAGKQARDAAEAEVVSRRLTGGRNVDVLFQEDVGRARRCADAVRRHPVARGILDPRYEVRTFESLAWNGPADYPCAGHPDVIHLSRPETVTSHAELVAVWDLKTTTGDLLPADAYARKVLDMGYHRQAGMYQMGVEARFGGPAGAVPFYHCTAQQHPPFEVAVYRFDAALVRKGRLQVCALIAELDERTRFQDWSSRWEAGEAHVPPPRWLNCDVAFP